MKITKGAHDRALASLAERAVIAEARAVMLEAELKLVKQHRLEAEDLNIARANQLREWWFIFWKARGFSDEELIKERVRSYQELEVDAADAMDALRLSSWPGPKNGEWVWPREVKP